ncbi:hypothetical protein [Kibdelosporangium philippinense]|uniref:hypothetical protein n=1 Tax=Kibdelosporangium philippinense TaxID=211113 RepID=UPI00360F771E
MLLVLVFPSGALPPPSAPLDRSADSAARSGGFAGQPGAFTKTAVHVISATFEAVNSRPDRRHLSRARTRRSAHSDQRVTYGA